MQLNGELIELLGHPWCPETIQGRPLRNWMIACHVRWTRGRRSIAAFERELGVSEGSVWRVEQRGQLPSFELLVALGQAGVSLDFLLVV